MASDIEVTALTDETFDPNAVRGRLAALGENDISKSSPVSPGAPEVAVDYNRDEDVVCLRVEGHEGSWTKTTQDRLLTLLRKVDGAEDPQVTAGGYETDE